MGPAAPDPDETLRRLRWQCRRGMLELDELLGRFLELGYAGLDASDLDLFTQLLREQDQDLHHWLIARSVPPPAPYQSLAARIRAVASAYGAD